MSTMSVSHRIAFAVACLLGGCTSFSLTGQPAPVISSGDWVFPASGPNAPIHGAWTVLEFFAPDDAVGLDDVPRLMRLQQIHGDDGLCVVGIAQADAERCAKFSAEYQVDYPVLANGQGEFRAWGVHYAWDQTTAFLVDPNGIVVGQGLDEIERMIRERLR